MLTLLGTACSSSGTPSSATATGDTSLLNTSGQGAAVTDSFQASSGWDVQFTYDCTGQQQQGFEVRVQRDGQPVNVLAERVGLRGEGVSRWPHPGEYALKITTSCAWTVDVK